MPKLAVAAGLSLIALAACTPEEEESVEDRFRRTEAAIENTAQDLEARTENAVRATEAALENQADAFENRIESIEPVETNEAEANQVR